MTRPFDPVALRIGSAYKRGLAAYVEAGRLLIVKKKDLPRGEWGPWLKANRSALGFGERTANLLMKAARDNPQLTADTSMALEQEKEITSKLWGNDKRAKGTPAPNPPSVETETADTNVDPNAHRFLFSTVSFIALVKKVLRDIDTDPSSCKEANDKFVKAKKYYSVEQDGRKYDWFGRVYLNPMYDPNNLRVFMEYLLVQLEKGNTTEAISITPNSSDISWFQNAYKRASAICYPLGRVKFHAPGTGKTGNPRLPSVVMYFGPNPELFVETFEKIGVASVLRHRADAPKASLRSIKVVR